MVTADITGIRWRQLPSGLVEVFWPSARGLPTSSGLQRSTARTVGPCATRVLWIENEPDHGNWQPVTSALEGDLLEEQLGRPARYMVGGGRGEVIDLLVAGMMRAAQTGRAA